MARDERGRASVPAGDILPRPRVSASALMLGSGPRFARDAFGPVLVFYVGWRLIGFRAAILAATALAIAAYLWERRQARSGITAGIGLGIALVQATAGLASGSTTAYFAPPIIINGAYGLAFLVSVVVGRPLAGVFARETYPFPPQVKASHTFRRVFSRISLVWATYLLLRTGLRFFALLHCGIVRPRALAVLRLITNSNLVGCSTGRSAGFAPLKILTSTAVDGLPCES